MRKISFILVILFIATLFFATIPTLAYYNYVEYEGYVKDDWYNKVAGAKVTLKSGYITYGKDYTDANGYYYIKALVSQGISLTLTASKTDNSSQTKSVPSRSLGEPGILLV